MDDNTSENEVQVIPNPNNGLFTVKLSEPCSTCVIAIYDTHQKLIKELTLSENRIEIDLSEFETGTYFLHISGDQMHEVVRVITIDR